MNSLKNIVVKISGLANLFNLKSLKTKIIVLILSATIPVIVSGMLNFFLNNYYMSDYFSIHEKLLSIDMILNDTVSILPIVKDYIVDTQKKNLRSKFLSIQKDIKKIESKTKKNSKRITDKYNFFTKDVYLYLQMCNDLMDSTDKLDTSARNNYNKIVFQSDNVKRSAIELTMQELNYGNDLRKDINKKIWTVYTSSLIFVIVWISLVIIMISIMLKQVVMNLKKLEEESQIITNGELSPLPVDITSKDEIGLLAAAFNEMTRSLKSAYSEIDKRQSELHLLNINLTESNKQLLKTNKDLENAQEHIIESEKLASLGSLVAGVSHEINTPIGVSVSAASYLKDQNRELSSKMKSNTLKRKEFENYSSTIEETTTILLTNLKRASELISSFKMIAVDQTSEKIREINLYNYIKDVILSLKHDLKKKSIEVNIDNVDKELMINTYPGILAQVFTNLIINSILHGFEHKETGSIIINVIKDSENLIIEYIDDGKGIDKDVIKKIFEPFYTTKKGLGGSGLGMFIVYNFINKYFKGSISCKSEIGKGVFFTIKLPLENY